MDVTLTIIAILSFLIVCQVQILFIYLTVERIRKDATNVKVWVMNGHENDLITADTIKVLKIKHQQQRNDHVICIKHFAKKSKHDSLLIKKDNILPEDKFDWRDKHVISPVLNQGEECMACWAISIVETMESMAAIRGIDTALTALSAQQLLDCTKRNGCKGGDVKKALAYLCDHNMGITTANEYPNTFKPQPCKEVKDGKRKIAEYWTNFLWDEEEITKKIFKHGPLIAAVNSNPWIFYTGGVIQNSCSSQGLNHIVQIVGYDWTENPPYYIIKNSWGTDWGIEGYVKIAIGSGLCGINKEVSYINVI